MTINGTVPLMDKMPRGKYVRTAETRAKNGAASRGRKLDPAAIARRTATRRERDGYGTVHGQRTTPTYHSWSNMIQRCTNPNAPVYRYYGARGITVCDRWRAFPAFLEDMGERPDGKTLDRIDNEGNYEPGNCRWATQPEQMLNRRRPDYYDRPPRTNECGHLDRPHKSRGMCDTCYRRFMRSRTP